MSANTRIEWATHTFNPWEGCQKVGPGCDHCYAEARNERFAGGDPINWGPGAPRRRTSTANWQLPLRWNAAHDAYAAIHGRRQRVFCASLADVFDNEVDPTWREDLFVLIAATPNLDWLLLTKRIGNVKTMCPPGDWKAEVLARQVRLGITVVNQPEANRDIRKLLATPAYRHFLSMEPLLGPVDITATEVSCGADVLSPGARESGKDVQSGRHLSRIDAVIVGGESGPGARPMHPAWVRSLRDQCERADIPFLFKQWGEWSPSVLVEGETAPAMSQQSGERWTFRDGQLMRRVGKKAAGRVLDGVVHDEFDTDPLLLGEA